MAKSFRLFFAMAVLSLPIRNTVATQQLPPGYVDPQPILAAAAKAIGGQFLHDVVQHPHQTLLWDNVFNLQVGIYNEMRQRWIAKGFDPEVAGTMAAHIANRYAGALPPEHRLAM